MGITTPTSYTELLQAVTELEASRYLSVASYTLLLYDLLLTLPEEVSIVWTAKWSVVKVLFLLNRYTVPAVITANIVSLIGLTPSLTVTFCQRVMLMVIWWQVISLAFVDVIVSLRIHALFGRRRSVSLLMGSLFLVVYTVTLAIAIVITAEIYGTVGYWATIGQWASGLCYASPPQLVWTVWLPLVIFEAIVCIITFHRTWKHWIVDGLPLREALISDGLIYFLLAFMARLFDLLLWSFASHELMLMGENVAFVLNTVICSRLLLNLRGVRNQEAWSEATGVVGSESSRYEKVTLWLADQGGQSGLSFLEQIYQRAYTPDIPRTFTHVDEIELSS